MSNFTITLGGVEYPIAKLPVGLMRRAAPAFVKIATDTEEGFDALSTVIIAGLQAADANFVAPEFHKITAEVHELIAAAQKIGELMGFVRREKAPESGEATPG